MAIYIIITPKERFY